MRESLQTFQSNNYSQHGEDGILEEVFSRLREHIPLDNWCVEFGAWDGVFLSNTCHLIRNKGYNAVLIEGNAKRVEQLNRNLPQANVLKICAFVHFAGSSSLDHILATTHIPAEFDFLSIDVDGVDYYILEGLQNFRPKIICIEFNPTIPNAVDFVQPKDFSVKQGSSARAILRLANSKGYQLIAVTGCNLMFVRNDIAIHVVDAVPTLEESNAAGNDPQYLFVGYDGTLLSNKGTVCLPWHSGIKVPLQKIQVLPRLLRVFSGDYGVVRRVAFALVFLVMLPAQFQPILAKYRRKR